MGTFYRSKHELVFVWKSGTAPHLNNFELGQHGRNRTNVWDYAGVNTFRSGRMDELQMHPTVKPVALVVDAIKDCSKQGDIVLDPFCGSGTIIVAAERTGRKARALEIDAAYVDVAIRRWEQLTGNPRRFPLGRPLRKSPNSELLNWISHRSRQSPHRPEETMLESSEPPCPEKPRRRTQFKPGQSGNPLGPPKTQTRYERCSE